MVNTVSRKVSIFATSVFLFLLLVYWGRLLLVRSTHPEYKGDWLPSAFIGWLAGWLTIIVGVFILGWLNYKWIYKRIQQNKSAYAWYFLWQIGLCWLLFEVLQWRTEHDIMLLPENMVVSVILSAIIYMISYTADAFDLKRKHRALEKEKIATELRALRSQLNPHFLFNALNTIYSETLSGNNQNSARLVHDLSGILRFALQQSQYEWVNASEEIDFLEKYIGLHCERLPQKARAKVIFLTEFDHDHALPPMLLLPFIENAIQYGMHSVDARDVRLRLIIENAVLEFESENAVFTDLQMQRKGTGQGINNVKQRLELLYPGRYKLQIGNIDDMYRVRLKVKLV